MDNNLSVPETQKKVKYKNWFTYIFMGAVLMCVFGKEKEPAPDSKPVTQQVNVNEKKPEYNPLVPVYYNSSGRVVSAPVKVLNMVVTPTTGNGYTFSIPSSVVYTDLSNMNIQLTVASNSNTVTSIYQVSLKSYTLTSVTINLTTSNTQLISILNTTVLGLVLPATVSGVTVHVRIEGI